MRRPPQRTCVACRRAAPKLDLVRVVRTPQGEIQLDLTGKLSGRGAYLCRQQSCLEQALRQRKLSRALGSPIGDDVAAALARALPGLTESQSKAEVKRVGHESS